jgi:hypothetical protein
MRKGRFYSRLSREKGVYSLLSKEKGKFLLASFEGERKGLLASF